MSDVSPPGRPSLWRREEKPTTEPPFDPTSWHGALVVMLGVAALLWVVQIINAAGDYALNRNLGLRPRELDGLWGVVAAPFLHDSYAHLFSNSIAFVLIGWVLLLSGLRAWLVVTGIVLAISGVLTWLVAPHGLIVGVDPLVLGWLGYLLARAYFSRRLKWIITAVTVLFFFGALLFSLLPSFSHTTNWQAHACGFVAGVAAGALLHPRRRREPKAKQPPTPAVF